MTVVLCTIAYGYAWIHAEDKASWIVATICGLALLSSLYDSIMKAMP